MPMATAGPHRLRLRRAAAGRAAATAAGMTGAATRTEAGADRRGRGHRPPGGRARSAAGRRGGPGPTGTAASTSFAIAVSTMRSIVAGMSGTIDDGGAGVSRTCLYATDTGLLGGERRDAGEHLVEHDAERVHVGAAVEREALRLLG